MRRAGFARLYNKGMPKRLKDRPLADIPMCLRQTLERGGGMVQSLFSVYLARTLTASNMPK